MSVSLIFLICVAATIGGFYLMFRGALHQRSVRKKMFEQTNEHGVVEVGSFEEGEQLDQSIRRGGCLGQFGALMGIIGLIATVYVGSALLSQ